MNFTEQMYYKLFIYQFEKNLVFFLYFNFSILYSHIIFSYFISFD